MFENIFLESDKAIARAEKLCWDEEEQDSVMAVYREKLGDADAFRVDYFQGCRDILSIKELVFDLVCIVRRKHGGSYKTTEVFRLTKLK